MQVRLRGDAGHWGPFKHVTTNITYALGRFEIHGHRSGLSVGSAFNDRPTQFFGPANEDRCTSLVEFPRGSTVGFQANAATRVKSSLASSLSFRCLPEGGEIFFSTWTAMG